MLALGRVKTGSAQVPIAAAALLRKRLTQTSPPPPALRARPTNLIFEVFTLQTVSVDGMPDVWLKATEIIAHNEYAIDRFTLDNHDVGLVILMTAEEEKIRDCFKLAAYEIGAWLMVPGLFAQNPDRIVAQRAYGHLFSRLLQRR